MVLINLLCMWKVSDQIEKEKEKKLEAKLTIKLEKVNHSSFIKPWHSKVTTESGHQSTSQGQLSTDRRKQEDKSLVSNTCVSYFIKGKIKFPLTITELSNLRPVLNGRQNR